WVQGMVQSLSRAGCEVTLVLKAPVRTGRLVDPLRALPGVTVRSPHGEGLFDGVMVPRHAATILGRLDEEERASAGSGFDLVVVRGRRVAGRLSTGPLAGRLWTYL